MAKIFSLEHFCEPLMDDPSYFSKAMFGGLAIYYRDLMVMVLAENPGDREWKGINYDFDLWNGVLLCTSREHHDHLKRAFPALTGHPVLGKWLYVPMSHPDFEVSVVGLVEAMGKGDSRIGIVPGQKSRRKSRKKAVKKKRTRR